MRRSSYVIGILGDFGGARSRTGVRALAIDRDDFDAVLSAIAPQARTELAFCPELSFDSFEGFTPDAICARVPALASLVEARRAVGDPARMKALIAAAGVDLSAEVAPSPAATASSRSPASVSSASSAQSVPSSSPPDGASLLDSILDERADAGAAPGPGGSRSRASGVGDPELTRWVREVALASVGRTDHATQDRWRDAIDATLSARMDALLHAPAVQHLESLWTGLRQLVVGTHNGTALRLRVIDAPGAELTLGTPVEDCLLREAQVPGGQPVDLVVYAHPVTTPGELRWLGRLARLLSVPVLAGTAERDHGAELEGIDGSSGVTLLYPRILLRLPHGRDSTPAELFPFEEQASPETPAAYLWGSPALALARCIAHAFTEYGDPAEVARFVDLEDLPFHVFRSAGAPQGFGPTEVPLLEPDIKDLAAAGIVPVIGYRGQDRARIGKLQTIARTPMPLAGR